jgi:hypothetical protein
VTIKIYKDQNAGAVFIENANGVQFLNALQATMDDPADVKVNIHDLSKDVDIFTQVPFADFVDQSGSAYGSNALDTVNALNAIFAASSTPSEDPPSITSSLAVTLTEGDSLNYELTATPEAMAWELELPSGVARRNDNPRIVVGGSNLAVGTYNIPVKAINQNGFDSETLVLTVSSAPYNNTKSVNFQNQDYLGANANLLDSVLGRSSNGSGSGDAWSISMWFKPSTSTNGQTVFYFGASDVTNSGFVEVRFLGSTDKLRLRYGSNNNYIQLSTPTDSLTHSAWNHILISYDGGTTGSESTQMSNYYGRFKIFIDGAQQTTSNSHSNFGYANGIVGQNLRVGRFASGTYMRDNCRVDELAVWGSDQSGNISDIYNSGSTHDLDQLDTPPNHWWRMGDGDTYPSIQDNVGTATFVMYNMTAADIVTDAP